MNSYEAMFIFRPSLNEEEQKTQVKELENILQQNQAAIEASQVFGRRRLAYEINKCKEGVYYLINFSAKASGVVSALERACNINENVLRTLVVRKKAKQAK